MPKIDVLFTPQAIAAPTDLSGRTVVVLDVLRATTSIVTALYNGAKAVLPAATTEEALRLAQNLERDDLVLAGERKSQKIPGFPLGNSPAEFTPEAVRGKTVVMSTSNGTPALVAAAGAKEVLVGAAVNFAAIVPRLKASLEAADGAGVMVLCAGHERQFALEDAFAAGRLVKVLLPEGGKKKVELNDGALAALEIARHFGERWLRAFRSSAHGRELEAQGFAEDLKLCAAENTHAVIPVYAERRITGHRPAPEG